MRSVTTNMNKQPQYGIRMNSRMKPEHRREDILKHAVKAASKCNYMHLTRELFAEQANCSPALISAYFGTMTEFRISVVEKAIEMENLKVISQVLIAADSNIKSLVDNIPIEVKQKALALVIQ